MDSVGEDGDGATPIGVTVMDILFGVTVMVIHSGAEALVCMVAMVAMVALVALDMEEDKRRKTNKQIIINVKPTNF